MPRLGLRITIVFFKVVPAAFSILFHFGHLHLISMYSFAYGSLSPFNQVRHIDLYMVYDDDDDDARESLRNPKTRRTSIHSLSDYKVQIVQIVPLVKVL